MADMDVAGPNWKKLREVRTATEEAERRGKLSYEKWKALLEEALEAAQQNLELLDFMVPYARPGWKERLDKDQTAKAIESPIEKALPPAIETTPIPAEETAPVPGTEAPAARKWPKINWRKTRW
jgi:hypothetical protein